MRHLAALAHDEDAVAHGQHLGQVGGDEDHGHARRGEVVDELVDLGLGADVDAARRFVEDEDRGSLFSHLPIITFCWLPPERLATGVSTDGVRMLQAVAETLGGRALGLAIEQAEAACGSCGAPAGRCWRRSTAA